MLLEIQTAHATALVRFDAEGDLTGDWDSDRLSQVFASLVGNAVQHGDGGLVRLVAHGDGSDVVVTVHNSGTPIPASAQHVIFEPLVRGPGADDRSNGSIGLGLFIARTIVESHGGHIGFTSSEADGTTFTVRLPRAEQAKVAG